MCAALFFVRSRITSEERICYYNNKLIQKEITMSEKVFLRKSDGSTHGMDLDEVAEWGLDSNSSGARLFLLFKGGTERTILGENAKIIAALLEEDFKEIISLK